MSNAIFAHRGASKYAPENTMAAFKLAYELGAEGIETDVQLTKDNVPVLIHDERVKRTTNGTGYIKDLTWSQVKQLDAGSWFSKKFTGTGIISLDEFLQWIQFKPLYLNIELKNNRIAYKHIESIVYERVAHYQLLDRTILSTFNQNSVQRMKSFQNKIDVAFLTSKHNKNLVTCAQELGVHALHIKYRLLKPRLLEACRQENIAVRVYTVNKKAHMMRCFAKGCDGFFTDVPDKGIAFRKLMLDY
ncbi:MAG TPA: glycerophosphodiester phosphodiesterase [Virgibacillus sp.]|nr:glycerophosphodiester phosphodiesterase [Virgibacillus sp.]